jgi:transcription antitermination factor NusG
MVEAISINQPHWYAAYLHPRQEKSVARQMQERGLHWFLPLYRSVRRWKDRRKEIELVLFPGYVFIYIALQDRLRVLQLLGVVRFVSFGGQPASLPDREVETLRAGLKENIYAEPHPYLPAGRRVQVIRGPFLGTHGILIRRKDKFRVVISLALITRAVSVEVDASDVQPLL